MLRPHSCPAALLQPMDTTELLFLTLSKKKFPSKYQLRSKGFLALCPVSPVSSYGRDGLLGSKRNLGLGWGGSVIVEMGPDHPAGAGFFQDLLCRLPESTVFLRCGLLLHSQMVRLGSD